jgi:hypothetical protein
MHVHHLRREGWEAEVVILVRLLAIASAVSFNFGFRWKGDLGPRHLDASLRR